MKSISIWFAYLLLSIFTFWPVEANLVNHDIMIQAKDLHANLEIRNDPVLSLVEALTMEDEVVDVDVVLSLAKWADLSFNYWKRAITVSVYQKILRPKPIIDYS